MLESFDKEAAEAKTFKRQSVYVWINTYNRPSQLDALLGDIYLYGGLYDVHVRVYNDASTHSYGNIIKHWGQKLSLECINMLCSYLT